MAGIIALALTRAAQYLILGIGFGAIYSVVRFFEFSFAGAVACGAYAGYAVQMWFGGGATSGALGALAAGATVGGVLQLAVYGPFRRRLAGATSLLLVSLGAYTVLHNVLSMVFGDATRSLRSGPTPQIELLGASLTLAQISLITAAAAIACGFSVWMQATDAGVRFRATAADSELFRTLGGAPESVIAGITVFGSSLAGLAGWLLAWDVGMTPSMGFQGLLAAVVVALVGGASSVLGMVCASLALASVEALTIWLLPAKWMATASYSVLLFAMLLRRGALVDPAGGSSRKWHT